MASSSSVTSEEKEKEQAYLYASNANVSNFVSVRLSGDRNYHLWKTQMLCLLKAHDMRDLVEDSPTPTHSSSKMKEKYDSLLKGWIFGSLSEDVLSIVVDSDSAKCVWTKLESFFGSCKSSDDQGGFRKSNPPVTSAEKEKERAYQYASNTNVSNFVSVRLSADSNYHLWKTQMLCLLEAHGMRGLVDDHGPTHSRRNTGEEYDSLLRGWIFGSLSEDVLRIVVDYNSAKWVWKKLERWFGSCKTYDQQVSTTKDENTNKTSNIDTNDPTKSTDKEAPQTGKKVSTTKDENTNKTSNSDTNNVGELMDKEAPQTGKKGSSLTRPDVMQWFEAFFEWDMAEIYYLLRARKNNINSDGNSILHIAVGIGRNDLTKIILSYYNADNLREIKNDKGSTVLHIAAIVGNTKAAELLVEKDKELLHIKDGQGKTPLIKAYENMRLDTTLSLLYASISKDDESSENASDEDLHKCINVLVQAILAKKYDIAEKIINQKADYAVSNDEVLMALARTFPSKLHDLESFFCPCFEDMREKILERTKKSFHILVYVFSYVKEKIISPYFCRPITCKDLLVGICLLLMFVPIAMIFWMFHLIRLALLMAYFQLCMLYYLLWKVATMIVPGIKNIELKKKEYEDAKKVLQLVCRKIKGKYHADSSSSRRELTELYTGPILEAACQDAYDVVDEILEKWPEAILCKDKKGFNIIQLATMHRSENIYNLINYTFGEHSNDDYVTMVDSYDNNMLHLAGRLAPSNRLKRHTGAALQLQSELQWQQEVKNLVFPTFVTKENNVGETPEMLFTREHGDLVNEGEKWIKAVAESCSITAALITTIVFAAAITVPGGSSQNGVPVFTNETAFLVFAFSDAISLFSSVTALLVFLSILTSRFAEQDFLVRLPRQLIIGLCTLLISTSAMMVAFGATLFLVFCRRKLWMIAPICGLAFVPIAIFFNLKFPLILDLFRSTYISRFGKNNHHSLKFFFVDKKRR